MSKDICPESTGMHGPSDAYGRCPWCLCKYAPTQRKPTTHEVSEMTWWYSLYWNPDHEALEVDKIREIYERGQGG